MMATVLHVTSGLGLRKFQADGFLLTRVYIQHSIQTCCTVFLFINYSSDMFRPQFLAIFRKEQASVLGSLQGAT